MFYMYQALRDLDDAIGPVMSTRRASRERMGSALYDKVIYSSSNLAPLPEALRPKPGKLSNAQQRVYEVRICLRQMSG